MTARDRRAAPELHVHLEVVRVHGLTAPQAEAAVTELRHRLATGPTASATPSTTAGAADAVRRALLEPGRLDAGRHDPHGGA